jgi:DNA repair protein RecN (Recombination protein N)
MLKHLLIENYALIKKLDIDFKEGLTVITGETGAGKSILLGALSMILGHRADTRVLLNPDQKCIIEGVFDIENLPLKDLFESHELDHDNTCIIRREITPQGKSRAFINDTPVNLTLVSEISRLLIDIHSQHQNLLIGEASFQTDVMDSFAGTWQQVAEYSKKFQELQTKRNQLQHLIQQELKSRADLDYFTFQYNELEQARLNVEEYNQMDADLQIMENAGEIKSNLEKASWMLDQDEQNLIQGLQQVINLIKPVGKYNQSYQELVERFESVYIETKDAAREMVSLASDVHFDPEKVLIVQQRLDLINRLLLKHNVAGIEDLMAVQQDFNEKILAIDSLEAQLIDMQLQVKTMEDDLRSMAVKISEKRKKAVKPFEQQITTTLHQLAMPGARFRVDISDLIQLSPKGIDKISFWFNANVGGDLNEVSKVASGGEISRLMLAVKSAISVKNLLPTIIFDEIDTGISGETAGRVANILRKISSSMQVITITHLPQIASGGHWHLLVYKSVDNGSTKTNIKNIEGSERIDQIAKMLGGENPSQSMINTAKELIFNVKESCN